MTTITLEVPDEVAARFKREPKAVSALLRKNLTAKLTDPRKPIHQAEDRTQILKMRVRTS